ncbi:long-chain-fatty-acid-CoA-ligase [Rhodocollybia butyracea]|uniref:Long-chain-fatty-acid-CoA-ligase n=1 Tax=Rhodocollybia butyracea TaxID=206335 RepID=A0A9P5Q4V8_9AGAR|nr:long-chain-fatty-acid-CoA-ligase [Rhodocollybia butyracea]
MPAVHTVKPGYFGKGSVEIGPAESPNESPIRRTAITSDRLIMQPFEGIDTVYDVVEYAARTHGTRRALGWRDIVEVHEEEKEVKKIVDGKEVTEKKKWKYFELSDYKYINFIELKEAVSEIARGLLEIGVTSDDVFNIFAQTSVNWQLMANACGSISTTIATAYDTLGEAGLTHSLNEPECVGLFTNAELLPTLYKVLANTPSIKFVVYDGEPPKTLVSDINAVRESIRVFSLNELRALGKTKPIEHLNDRRPKPETMACIMYTSGSTGPPKGVCITHANLVASIGAVYALLGHHLTYDDTYLAYLPLAHVLEYIVELIMIFVGMTSGYGRVKTLTDASVRKCKGDLAAFQPSIMVGVPAVWETIRKGIVAKVNAGGTLRKSVFNGAMSLKRNHVPVLAQVADSVVLKGVRAATGGRLRITLSGGAAISHETQRFLDTALVTILQGYGMTESCGMCAILPPELMRYNSVGLPVPSVEIKLLDVKDAGYISSNNPPQGEVCIRGPSVTKGYYKRPDLNNDETIFTKDGWMRTGDVGQWNEDGTLSLIDRVKNLVKLQGGEYIALERLESTYKACNYVGNMCVHATADAKQPIAIIIPHEVNLRHALQSTNIDSSKSLPDLCHDPKVAELVLKECNAVGKKNGFKPMEILQAVILTPEEWTPENGLVTAAQKIQRNKIAKEFAKEIEQVYKEQ